MSKSKASVVNPILFAVSSVLIVLGLLFLVSAAELVSVFPFFKSIDNVLLRYIIVIVTMAAGIMLFSNAAARIKAPKKRNATSIAITVFSSVLTLPLVYVFAAIFFAQNGMIDPIGEIMMMPRIVEGFNDWFGSGAFVYVVYAFMFLLSLVFLAVPIFSCALTCKSKTLKIGKTSKGKFGAEIVDLPSGEE